MVLEVGTKYHYLFYAGEQCWIKIQLNTIGLATLVVGLLRFEQEVRAEGKRLQRENLFSGSNHRK